MPSSLSVFVFAVLSAVYLGHKIIHVKHVSVIIIINSVVWTEESSEVEGANNRTG